MAGSKSREMEASEPRGTQRSVPGVVSLQELYTVDEAKGRLGWTDSALRSAKRQGLQLLKCGKRRYVTGVEILRFLESMSAKDNA